MQAFITKDCFTDHGGRILEGDDSWIVEGKGVHLEGMTHYCPKCKVLSKAIATQRGFIQVNGRNIIVAGDTSTCGSKYIKISDLAIRCSGSGSGNTISPVSNLRDALKFDERIQLVDKEDNEPLSNVSYYLKNSKTGDIVDQGITDHNGYTARFYTEKSEDIDIYIGEPE